MLERVATCSCGELKVTANGEPTKVSICHCNACQKRTGSAFGVAVFFGREAVNISGSPATYERLGSSGKNVEFHFCPKCGSTVYWYPEVRPALVAVALGCFDGGSRLLPSQSVYEESRHSWVNLSLEG